MGDENGEKSRRGNRRIRGSQVLNIDATSDNQTLGAPSRDKRKGKGGGRKVLEGGKEDGRISRGKTRTKNDQRHNAKLLYSPRGRRRVGRRKKTQERGKKG